MGMPEQPMVFEKPKFFIARLGTHFQPAFGQNAAKGASANATPSRANCRQPQ
jgi:hypothetical protein